MHFDVVLSVFIHAQKSGGGLNSVFTAELPWLSVRVHFRCVRRKLLTLALDCSAHTIPSVLYAHLVPSGSPYIESWYVRLNENTCVGGNA